MSVRSTMDLGLAALTAPSESSSVVGVVAAVGAAVAGIAVLGVSSKNPFYGFQQIWIPADQADSVQHILSGVKSRAKELAGTEKHPFVVSPGDASAWPMWFAARLRELGMSGEQSELWGARLTKEPTEPVLDVLADALLERGPVSAAELLASGVHERPILVVAATGEDYVVYALHGDSRAMNRLHDLEDKQFMKALLAALGSRAPEWMRALGRRPRWLHETRRRHLYLGEAREPCAVGMEFQPPYTPPSEEVDSVIATKTRVGPRRP